MPRATRWATTSPTGCTSAATSKTADQHPILLAHDFGTSAKVHHCNYFEQPETVKALRAAFSVGSPL